MSMSMRRYSAMALATMAGVIAGVLLIGVAPASAHDQLLASSPAENEHLEEAPTEVSLTFSDDVLAFEGMGAVVRISGSDGRTWQQGDAVSEGSVVTTAVDPAMPDGAFTLAWQVVSADGHTISGVVPFTVGEVSAAPTVAATPEPTSAAVSTDAPAAPFPPALRTILVGAGGALAALALYWLVSRARQHFTQSERH